MSSGYKPTENTYSSYKNDEYMNNVARMINVWANSYNMNKHMNNGYTYDTYMSKLWWKTTNL